MEPWLTTLLIGGGVVSLLMLVLWLISILQVNAGWVDVGWTFALGILAGVYALTLEGWFVRRTILAVMVGFWSIRLGTYLVRDRVMGKPEEGRYITLRERWGVRANRNFFWFFQAQGVLDILLSIPFLIICLRADDHLSGIEIAGIILWFASVAGESLADLQLARFKSNSLNKGKTCRRGLWNYSRHPNYFFEWLIWCSYAVMCIESPWGWLGLLSPALILFLVLKVTGIPPTEEQALKSRGDEYRRYQQTTSAFIPWFPKKEPA